MIWGSNTPDAPAPAETKKAETIMKEPSFLEMVENRIYFYSEIERDKILMLNKNLREMGNRLVYNAMSLGNLPPSIKLHISSYGGGIFHGLAGMDEILQSRVMVETIIDGCCASAATFLSVVGKRRYINRHAYMLIHQLSNFMWGKYTEFEDEMKNMDRLMKMIKDIYAKHTAIPEKKIDELLKHDLWFDAQTCLKYKMVDEIIG